MKVLIVAATHFEFAPLKAHLNNNWVVNEDETFSNGRLEVTLLTTGVGMVATTFCLSQMLMLNAYDLVIQMGIAGSFEYDKALTEVVFVVQDQFGDIGAEDGYNFLDVFNLNLIGDEAHLYQNKQLLNPYDEGIGLRKVNAISVNTVSGTDFTASLRCKKYNAQIESMEGAAFHYVCLKLKKQFMQIRSTSNYVERRNRELWKMKEAIETLNEYMIGWIENTGAKKQ